MENAMSDRPGGADLLRTARDALLKQVMPQSPAGLRYELLMIANAMAIAARELEAGAEFDYRELAGMGQLLGVHTSDTFEDNGQPASALAAQRRILRAQIRAGRYDSGAAQRALLRHLQATVRDKLALSNPKLLTRENGEADG
jgi:hypothetical protein